MLLSCVAVVKDKACLRLHQRFGAGWHETQTSLPYHSAPHFLTKQPCFAEHDCSIDTRLIAKVSCCEVSVEICKRDLYKSHLCDLLSKCAVQRCQHSCGVTLPALQFLCLCPGSCLSSCYLHHMNTMQADQTRDLLCYQPHPT